MKAWSQMQTWLQPLHPWLRSFTVAWHRHVGRPGWVALALLGALVLLQAQLRPLLLRDQARLQLRQQALAGVPVGARAIEANALREPATLHELPSPRQRGRDIEWLVSAAQRSGLSLERADYALAAATAGGATRVEATLPLSGTYGQLRQFVAAALNELPHSALESLQIERPNTQSPQLQATARLALFYREEAP